MAKFFEGDNREESDNPLLNELSLKIITEHFGASWVGVTAAGMLKMIDDGDVKTLDELLTLGLSQPNQEEHYDTIRLAYEYLKENAALFGLIPDTS